MVEHKFCLKSFFVFFKLLLLLYLFYFILFSGRSGRSGRIFANHFVINILHFYIKGFKKLPPPPFFL